MEEKDDYQNFVCAYCGREVSAPGEIGTRHRNHCPFCLFSKHVDLEESGDRAADCKSLMEPIGLTFKEERIDKYGKEKQGEIMLIHRCQKCGKISINRIAADDEAEKILELVGKEIDRETARRLEEGNIALLGQASENEIRRQLFGGAEAEE